MAAIYNTPQSTSLSPSKERPQEPSIFDSHDCLSAFDSIDRSIRTLIEIDQKGMSLHHPKALDFGHISTPQSPPSSIKSPPQSPGPCTMPTLHAPGSDSDEDATIAFLCSTLPHHEGMPPINYDSLDDAFGPAFGDGYGDSPDEESVAAESWESDVPSPPEATDRDALDAYEGWIDFSELRTIVQSTLSLTAVRFGTRRESDYMLFYPIEPSVPGDEWLVQIPKPSVPAHVFASEIATMAHVRTHTELPIARVAAHDFTSALGAPYAIISRLPGVALTDLWDGLGSRERHRALGQIARVVVQLSELEVARIGSLALSDSGRIFVGPLFEPRHLEPEYAAVSGPFASVSEYFSAMVGQSHAAAHAASLDAIELDVYARLVDAFVVGEYDCGPFVVALADLDKHHFLFDADLRLTGVVNWTYSAGKPLQTLVQAPAFTFDDAPRWEPRCLDARLAYRRNLVRYRRWFMAELEKCAWARLGKARSRCFARLVGEGYWRYKFESEITECIRYSNPWTFRAIWEHVHGSAGFAVWFCDAVGEI